MRVPLEWLKEFVAIRLSTEALAERLTMAGLEVTGITDAPHGPVFELEITPNRADCLSIIGVAREVAAITGAPLKSPRLVQGSGFRVQQKPPRTQNPEPRTSLVIRIEDRRGCRRYIGRLIDGVRIEPSPSWMQRRLNACGIRAINNVVDITNYVLLEYGQPLHAFDFDRVAEGTILVRRARAEETLLTLDGERTTLRPEMLVIADAKQPVAVAGVMGGEVSAVTPPTRRVLLESAWFDPLTVRRTARALGLSTESSYRFERGVDPIGIETASVRAAGLIAKLAGGWEAPVCDVGRQPPARTTLALNLDRASRWLGTPVSSAMARTSLARLGCRVASAGSGSTLHVTAPSYRADLRAEVDLYEELARTLGYDRIPAALPAPASSAQAAEEGALGYRRAQSLRCLCASLGLIEAMSWSLVSESDLARFGIQAAHAIRIANPLSQDHVFLQPSLLIGLARAVQRNLSQGAAGIRLFEVGRTIVPDSHPTERLSLGLALSGMWTRDWQGKQPADFFRLKGLLETLTSRLCAQPLRVEPGPLSWAEPQQAVALSIGSEPLGVAGLLSRVIAHALDCGEHDVWLAELSVEALTRARRATAAVQTPSLFPSVKRDLSFYLSDPAIGPRPPRPAECAGRGGPAVGPSASSKRKGGRDVAPCGASEEVPRALPVGLHAHAYEQVAGAIREAIGPSAHLALIDRYAGTQVPEGCHSLTFSIEYRDPTRTLTADEVDTLHRRVGQMLAERFGATLR